MTIELLYTSAAQGLKQGSRGFCTVICTAGLPINLAQRLEALSGYRHVYQPGDQRAEHNPVCYSHIRLAVGGKTLSILSRIGAYGVDYSQRTNKIAHHVVFDGAVPVCGPAAVLSQSGIMRSNWDGACKTLPSGPQVSPIALQPAACQGWQRITGDAGWASVVVNAWLQPTGKPVWIIFIESQSTSLLDLMQEATAILPESRRWQATFSTYCTNLPPDVECRVRCVLAGSDEARMSIARGTVLDLTKPLGLAPNNDATEAARNGFTIGANIVHSHSATELPDASDQSGEDIESALAILNSEDSDYRLKSDGTSRLPIPLALPSHRQGDKKNRSGSKASTNQTASWKVFAAASLVLVFLSLLGIAMFYLSTKKNPLAGIVDDASKQIPDHRLGDADVPEPADPNVKIGGASEDTKPQEVQLSLKINTEFKLLENDSKEKEQERWIGTVAVNNAKWSEVTLSAGTGIFEYRSHDGRIYLIAKEGGYNYEETQTLDGELKVRDVRHKFSISVQNVDEPNLVVVIYDESGKSSATSVFEGAKLRADVEAGSNDDDEAKAGKRTYSWKGRQGKGEWTEFAKTQDVSQYSQFNEVYCEMSYATSIPSPVTTVRSGPIRIQPIGKAEIDFESIFFAKDISMKIDVTFPELADVSPKVHFPYRWMEHDNYLVEKKLQLEIKLESTGRAKQLNFPVNVLKPVVVHEEGTAIGWLHEAASQSKVVRDAVSELKKTLPLIPTNWNELREFVIGIHESPTEEFFQSIERLNGWLEDAVMFKRRQDEKKQLGKSTSKTDEDIERAEIKRLQVEFGRLFPNSLLADKNAGVTIVEFAREWDLARFAPQFGRINKCRDDLTNLSQSIAKLRSIMNSFVTFEIVLESTDKVRIWRDVPMIVANGTLSVRKKDADAIFYRPFRVRTKVNFQDFKTEKQDTNKNRSRGGHSDDTTQDPASASSKKPQNANTQSTDTQP